MKAGQRADSNFHNFNDIDTACYETVAVKKKDWPTSYHLDLALGECMFKSYVV